ncbi:MAG: ABC transporter permease [Rhodanobacteraceae bacterium]|nr:ABC transporter permease [Rhodanobacteraceae bacterium]HRX99791.1 ABC transporter permease [Xanthomonadaceae bacterium]
MSASSHRNRVGMFSGGMLFRYFELLKFRVFADLKSEASRTYLGMLWWLFEPLLYLLILYFVFGHLRGGSGEGFAAFLFVGLVIWQWIRSTVAHCADSIRNNMHMLRQVRLPPALFPLIVICTDTFKFLVVLLILLVMLPIMGVSFTLQALWLPLALLPTLLLILGAGLFVAALPPVIPDVKLVIDTVLTALMFVSGIFFRADSIPEKYRWVMDFNPVALCITSARHVLLDGVAPDSASLGYVASIGVVLGVLGLLTIMQLSPRYTKQVI